MKLLRITVFSLVFLTVLFFAGSIFFAWLFTHPRKKPLPPNFIETQLVLEDITIETADSTFLSGWYIPAQSASVLILLHGYRGNRMQNLERARLLNNAGYNVLMYDARGCGASGGEFSSLGYHEKEDLLAAIKYVQGRGNERVGCLGISMGAATILMAADELDDVGVIICESAYMDMESALENRFNYFLGMSSDIADLAMVPAAEYFIDAEIEALSPLHGAAQLKCPVLLVSGTADQRTLLSDTQALYNTLPEPRELCLIEGAAHEDLYRFDPQLYESAVLEFLAKYFPSQD